MKLTIRKSEMLGDWYVIERAEHDGREWLETIGPNAQALRCSSRFSDADVEGTASDMLEIAAAIEKRGSFSAKRCAVLIVPATAFSMNATAEFWSPRNSRARGAVTLAEADELAALIRKEVAR